MSEHFTPVEVSGYTIYANRLQAIYRDLRRYDELTRGAICAITLRHMPEAVKPRRDHLEQAIFEQWLASGLFKRQPTHRHRAFKIDQTIRLPGERPWHGA